MSWPGFLLTGRSSQGSHTDFFRGAGQRGPSMSEQQGMSRRTILVKVGIVLNGIVGAALAVPILRFLLSPVTREKKFGYESWLSLGGLEQFPAGQTRLATYRNPVVNSWDGETGDIACWVRNVDDQTFQVFAINCAHLGCPVRWFPQSSLFMCPCHGGAYYQDGSRASGPPERGLFQYKHKLEDGKIFIKAGEMPTPGRTANTKRGGTTCA
jgi:nitrite reductase/ring-hydroxylating ferredoxin subunit